MRARLRAFIKHCLLPRLTRSQSDAVYCHYFCALLHELDVPNWPAGFFWDEVSHFFCHIWSWNAPIT
jgi:hypothetical protein